MRSRQGVGGLREHGMGDGALFENFQFGFEERGRLFGVAPSTTAAD